MRTDRYTEAVTKLASILNLSDDAIAIAEGWAALPEPIQRHFKLLLDEYVASALPVLQQLYSNACHADQLRFNRIAERLQADRHTKPPNG